MTEPNGIESPRHPMVPKVAEIAHALKAAGFGNTVSKFHRGEHSAWLTDGSEMWITEALNRGKIIGYDVMHRDFLLVVRRTISEAVDELVARHGRPTIADDHDAFIEECGFDKSLKCKMLLSYDEN